MFPALARRYHRTHTHTPNTHTHTRIITLFSFPLQVSSTPMLVPPAIKMFRCDCHERTLPQREQSGGHKQARSDGILVVPPFSFLFLFCFVFLNLTPSLICSGHLITAPVLTPSTRLIQEALTCSHHTPPTPRLQFIYEPRIIFCSLSSYRCEKK